MSNVFQSGTGNRKVYNESILVDPPLRVLGPSTNPLNNLSTETLQDKKNVVM